MGVVRGRGDPWDMPPPGVRSITRQGVTIEYADGSPKVATSRTSPCRYCRTRLTLDGRGRCRECGAPEHLADASTAVEPDWLLMDTVTL